MAFHGNLGKRVGSQCILHNIANEYLLGVGLHHNYLEGDQQFEGCCRNYLEEGQHFVAGEGLSVTLLTLLNARFPFISPNNGLCQKYRAAQTSQPVLMAPVNVGSRVGGLARISEGGVRQHAPGYNVTEVAPLLDRDGNADGARGGYCGDRDLIGSWWHMRPQKCPLHPA